MANKILIIGDSGKGKSTSIRTLNPEETFIINVENKALPWKGFKKQYTTLTKENTFGNLVSTDNPETIMKIMDRVDADPKIKVLIVDDAQYVMANEYMRKALLKGYEKYSEINKNFFNIIDKVNSLKRDDLVVVFMMHSEVVDDGMGNKAVKAKTIGKMIDSTITLEGKFTVVLFADVERTKDGNKYYFHTENNGSNTCKSPDGMFNQTKIPNDLAFVIEEMKRYEE